MRPTQAMKADMDRDFQSPACPEHNIGSRF